eukprot:m.361394 g.361394  ORF g.361394 m.361394 type:complete len:135 (-) comp19957_c0_seq5:260-664(-)
MNNFTRCRHSAGPAGPDIHRVRLPRALGPDRAVRAYNAEDASGRHLMLRLNRMLTEERFVYRVAFAAESLMVTSERVVILSNQDGDAVVKREWWFSGLYDTEVLVDNIARDDRIFYASFLVSEEVNPFLCLHLL